MCALSFAQAQEATKVIIITKTIDANGNVSVEKTVREGDDMDAEEINKWIGKSGGNANIWVAGDDDKKGEKDIEIEIEKDDDDADRNEQKIIIFQPEDENEAVEVFKIKGDDGEDIQVRVVVEDDDEDDEALHTHKSLKSGGAFLGVVAGADDGGPLTLREVVEDSPAEKAGLQKGDVLQSINGQKIENFENLIETLSQFKPNDEIEIGYVRDGKPQTAKATLAGRKGKAVAKKKIIRVDAESLGNDDDHRMIWIQKGDDDEDDDEDLLKAMGDASQVIIEETVETYEENGKTIVKKTKTIKKVKE
ncbi:MAG: PDZ domain-containing protein [Bacteroidetes bacterium]|nr:MAG: PDZ domain-containing protein [Bacteroidota bacterium]